jgi:hypothetical protein
MADITIVNGVYKPTYNWGAPCCTKVYDSSFESGDLPIENEWTWDVYV